MKTREQNLFCDSRHGHAGRAVAGVETTGSRLGVVGWLLVVVGVGDLHRWLRQIGHDGR